MSHDTLVRLVDAVHDGAVLAGPDGRVRHANAACLAMFGYSEDQVVGEPVAMLDTMDLALGTDRGLTSAISAQGVWEGYSAGLHHDGSTFPMSITVVSVGNDVAGDDGFIVFFRNTSDGMQALEDLRSALYLARSARQTRRQIVNSITHEFRTPIAAIIGFADLLDGMKEVPTVGHEFVSAIRSSADRLKVLVESVIDYANLQAERTVVHVEPYDVRARLAAFTGPVERRVRTKGIAWKLVVEPAVPPAIDVDGEKLEHVLDILLDNATKFTSAGEIALRVALPPAIDDAVNFEVSDTGVGFDARTSEQLFEPFRQGDEGLNRRFPGIGIGLALARQLTDLLGGTLRTTSAKGKGSTFTMTLPLIA